MISPEAIRAGRIAASCTHGGSAEGEAVRIHFFEPDQWVAQRRDTWASLTASTPLDLRDKIVADYAAKPVGRHGPTTPPPADWIPRLHPDL